MTAPNHNNTNDRDVMDCSDDGPVGGYLTSKKRKHSSTPSDAPDGKRLQLSGQQNCRPPHTALGERQTHNVVETAASHLNGWMQNQGAEPHEHGYYGDLTAFFRSKPYSECNERTRIARNDNIEKIKRNSGTSDLCKLLPLPRVNDSLPPSLQNVSTRLTDELVPLS